MAFDASQLAQRLRPLLEAQTQLSELCIGLSGGLDSTVLLHACSELQTCDWLAERGLQLSALHVNHGLQPQADAWLAHSQQQCQQRQIAFSAIRVAIEPHSGMGLEGAARDARYQAFSQQLSAHQCLLLGHHGDDQAETLLLRLMRGAGVRGLAGMPRQRDLGDSLLYRPLLDFSRRELMDYAVSHGLHWVEDSSNRDTRFDRNLLRQQVLPVLRQRWPQVDAALQRSADFCREATLLNDELAALDLAALAQAAPPRLYMPALRQLSAPRQRNLLRFWLSRHGCSGLGHQLLANVLTQLLAPGEGPAQLAWRDQQLHRFQQWLILQRPLPEFTPTASGSWHLPAGWQQQREHSLSLPGNGSLLLQRGGQLRLASTQVMLHWRYRLSGESCRLAGRPHKALKQVLQEAAVPPWLRPRLPLLAVDGELAAVPGAGVCEGHVCDGQEPGWQLTWLLGDWRIAKNSFVEKTGFW